MDKRKPLRTDIPLIVCSQEKGNGPHIEFHIYKEIGRGGSCIVYHAGYTDSVGVSHLIRLKEYCPGHLNPERDASGRLHPREADRTLFEQEKEKFIQAYKSQVEIGRRDNLSNVTVSTFQLYYGNGTVYTVMDYQAGTDYGRIETENLQEALERVHAVTGILKKYHHEGFLHLDIKPENIWILPETNQTVCLFDFDSVVKKEELSRERTERMAYTEGFAAPELIAGDIDRIGPVTDIYGVGALLFHRLMRRCPGRRDREFYAEYDFEQLKKENAACQPRFFRRLQEFFHKTLAAAKDLRYQTMEETAAELEELIHLADDKAVYPVTNFSYHQNCFIGRRTELEEIRHRLSEKHLLFLHGSGGIGKTELALRHAYENQEQYDAILFLRVENNLMESLCRSDISLFNFSAEESESWEDYGKRKLAALKKVLSKNDLLILDNFDEDEDETLEEILDLPCRILITSRCDFSDWNYPQMEIKELENMEELLSLFRIYNEFSYSADEMQAVKDMIERMECHTMLTELLAKNLKVSGKSPLSLRESLEKEQGIAGLQADSVCHRKDKKRLKASVYMHLKMLFDVSGLREQEIGILENLSLFAGMRIKKERFLKWSKAGSKKTLEELIRRGWIEGRREDDKISLHQIVLDLIYEDRKPGGHSCRALTRAMTAYAKEKPGNRTERETRNRLCLNFGRRLQGEDRENADFYLSYCKNIRYKKEWILFCLKMYEKNPEQFQEELAEVYCLNGKDILRNIDSLDNILKESLQKEIADRSFACFDQAIQCRKNAAEQKGCGYGEFLFSVGTFCNNQVENTMAEDGAAVYVYEYARKCMETGAEVYEQEENKEREVLCRMYDNLIDFFDPDAFNLVRPQYFGNVRKRFYYARKREELRPVEETDEEGKTIYRIDCHDISYTEAAEQAERAGDLETAAYYYELAEQHEEDEIIYSISRLGTIYEQLGQYEKAISFFRDKYKEEEGEKALHIGQVYRKAGQMDLAWDEIRKSAEIFSEEMKENEHSGRNFLKACTEASFFAGEPAEDLWKKGIKYYEEEKENLKWEPEVLNFQIQYARSLMEHAESEKEEEAVKEKIAELLYHAGENCLKNYIFTEETEEIIERLKDIQEQVTNILLKYKIMKICAGLVSEKDCGSAEREKEFSEKALKILEDSSEEQIPEKTAELMMLRDRMSDLCSYLGLYEESEQYNRLCDYMVIARWKSRKIEKEEKDQAEQLKEQIEIWKDQGEKSRKPGEVISCYSQAAKLWNQQEEKNKRDTVYLFGRIMEGMAETERDRGDHEKVVQILSRWHREVMSVYREDRQDNGKILPELERIAEKYAQEGLPEKRLMCRLQQGMVELEILHKGENIEQAVRIFSARLEQGIPEKKIDAVLNICDEILNLCEDTQEYSVLCEACRRTIREYREQWVSFGKK